MKKIFIIILSAFLLMGCEIDALNYYQEAVIKTGQVKHGKSDLDLNVELTFSDEFKEAEADMVELLSEVNYQAKSVFNREKNLSIVRQYLGNDAFGFDTINYKNDGDDHIRVPFTGKFLKLDPESIVEGLDFSVYDEDAITAETEQAISKLWFDLVSEDDVVNLGDEVIDTPEGEVKVKKMVVSFSNEQIHDFLDDVLVLISEDDVFKEQVKKYPMYYFEDKKLVETEDFKLDVETAIDSMRLLFDDIIVNEMKFVTYIDIDKYIVQHEYDVSLSFKGDIESLIEGISFTSRYQLFDLHEENEFDFPKIEDQDTITIDEILELLEFEITDEE